MTGVTAVTAGVAGCVGRRERGTDSPSPTRTAEPTATPTPAASPTQATALGTIEYAVTNEDDETHRLEVAMESADGRVVQETFQPEFRPGERVESGSAGHEPDQGPFTLTFRTDATSETAVWDVEECVRLHLAVTITTDGSFAVDRDLCRGPTPGE